MSRNNSVDRSLNFSAQANMTGRFIIEKSYEHSKKRLAKILALVAAFLACLSLLSLIFRGLDLYFILWIAAVLIIGFVSLALYFLKDPIENTVIEIDRQKIVRSGPGLATSTINLRDFGTIDEDERGFLLRKRGLKTTLAYYMSDRRNTDEEHIIFVPRGIQHYQEIRAFVIQINSSSNR